MLDEFHSQDVRVLVVWEPILPTDWRRPTTPTLARISDPRVAQFWDPHHLVSQEIKRSFATNGLPDPGHSSGGNLWDIAVLYSQGAPMKNVLPAPAFLDGPVVDVATQLANKMRTTVK